LNLPPDRYVTKIDVKKNIVTVGPRGSEFLNQKEISLTDWHRIGQKYDLPLEVGAKIRYRQIQPAKCRLSVTRDA
jgi:tRNA U34 2-thiouridine synthase MnmA/TrmU